MERKRFQIKKILLSSNSAIFKYAQWKGSWSVSVQCVCFLTLDSWEQQKCPQLKQTCQWKFSISLADLIRESFLMEITAVLPLSFWCVYHRKGLPPPLLELHTCTGTPGWRLQRLKSAPSHFFFVILTRLWGQAPLGHEARWKSAATPAESLRSNRIKSRSLQTWVGSLDL